MAEFDEKIYDDIDRYLQGQMEEAERRQFDQAIAGDPLLKEEVNFQRTMINAVKHARRQELKDFIRKNAPAASSGAGSGMKLVRLAAAVLLVGGAGFLLYTLTQKESGKEEVAVLEQGRYSLDQMPLESETLDTVKQGYIAENSNREKVQPPPFNLETEESEEEYKSGQNGAVSGQDLAVSEDAVVSQPEPASSPRSEQVYVTVIKEEEEEKLQKAAATPQKRSLIIDFHPGADTTGYRLYPANLELYGVKEGEAGILELNDTMYLELDRKIYLLDKKIHMGKQGTFPLHPLIKVTDKKLLRRLRR